VYCYSLEETEDTLLETLAICSFMKVSVAIFDEVLEHLDCEKDSVALLFLEDVLKDGHYVAGVEVGVIYYFHHA
jgi:hypothetical protein